MRLVLVNEIRRAGETSSLPLATAGAICLKHSGETTHSRAPPLPAISTCLSVAVSAIARTHSLALPQDCRSGYYSGPYGNVHAMLCHVPAGTGSHAGGFTKTLHHIALHDIRHTTPHCHAAHCHATILVLPADLPTPFFPTRTHAYSELAPGFALDRNVIARVTPSSMILLSNGVPSSNAAAYLPHCFHPHTIFTSMLNVQCSMTVSPESETLIM